LHVNQFHSVWIQILQGELWGLCAPGAEWFMLVWWKSCTYVKNSCIFGHLVHPPWITTIFIRW